MTPGIGTTLLAWLLQQAPSSSAAPPALGSDVPLVPLPGASSLGITLGVSFLDYDADGWIDLFVNLTGELRRNENGLSFPVVADLDVFLPVLPPMVVRYGSSCADYDEDGLPDIAGEPHGGGVCLYLLENLDGAGNFLDVAQDSRIVPAPLPCSIVAETLCWADTDDDGDLDLFAPAYPDDIAPGSGAITSTRTSAAPDQAERTPSRSRPRRVAWRSHPVASGPRARSSLTRTAMATSTSSRTRPSTRT